MPNKELKKGQNKLICGVCAGIGEYFSMPAWVVRVIWVAAAVFTLTIPVVLIYVVMALGMPDYLGRGGFIKKGRGMIYLAALLVAVGLFIILRTLVPQITNELVFAVFLIALGGYLIFRYVRKER
ncbi:MAG: PspC domain-containing protein [Eubacteriales bacterium]|nr:PspC domain-containing protein [Eubacteriales bacterium]